MLPPVVRLFADDMETANYYLNTFFSPDILASEPCVGTDTESWGRMEKISWLADVPTPISQYASATYNAKNGIRLLQLAISGFVLAIDVWATDGFPPRAVEILEDPTVVKTGANLVGDAYAIAVRKGHALLNGVELSHLYKCLHPSPAVAPLSTQFSLGRLSSLILDHEPDKELQTSDWGAETLTPEQVYYAQDDALIAYLVYAALEPSLSQVPWNGFNANAFTFNCAYVVGGRIVTTQDQHTRGRDVKVWGVFEDPASPVAWTPKHTALALWSKGVYNLCRNLSPAAFCQELLRRRLAYHTALLNDLLTYVEYRRSIV
ncbi:ribonuclease H-like domain-containing protein [Schizophyllum commune]